MLPASYLTVAPHPLLRAFIEYYRVDRKEGALDRPMPRRILPDGSSHLLFYVYGAHSDVLVHPHTAATCALRYVGARSIYTDIDQRRRALTLIVRFRPGGASPFFSIPAFELADRGYKVQHLWGKQGTCLLERLAAAPTLSQKIQHLDALFLHRVTTTPPPKPVVQGALQHLDATRGRISIQTLADALGRSERHLRDTFRHAVGLNPKTYARILRVRHTLREAALASTPSWPSLALDAGFFDQAHLIHDFQALLGDPPVAFLQRRMNLDATLW